ncbi:hypothetical protein [Atlantibacter subterraneus]
MEPVLSSFTSYPIFLWITWCKILFIVSDLIWKTQLRQRFLPMNNLYFIL